jgi:hypothetical protein
MRNASLGIEHLFSHIRAELSREAASQVACGKVSVAVLGTVIAKVRSVGGGLPGAGRFWGKNRFLKEIHDQGFVLKGPTRSDNGLIYTNPTTGAEVRIMPRPDRKRYRGEPLAKFEGDFYYRYRPGPDQPWGPHQPLPGK